METAVARSKGRSLHRLGSEDQAEDGQHKIRGVVRQRNVRGVATEKPDVESAPQRGVACNADEARGRIHPDHLGTATGREKGRVAGAAAKVEHPPAGTRRGDVNDRTRRREKLRRNILVATDAPVWRRRGSRKPIETQGGYDEMTGSFTQASRAGTGLRAKFAQMNASIWC